MLTPAGHYRIFIASEAIDFRKGMDGLAAHIANTHGMDPYNGAIYIFRSKANNRLKLIMWDGTGLVLVSKRMERKCFVWPKMYSGTVALSKVQFDALFEGTNWQSVVPPRLHQPRFI